jgi:hypothetical protein
MGRGDLARRIPEARLRVFEGESVAPYLEDAGAVADVLEAFLDPRVKPGTERTCPDGLTQGEVDVLRLLAAGRTNYAYSELATAMSRDNGQSHLLALIFYCIRWMVKVSSRQAQMNWAGDDSDCHLKDGEAVHLSARARAPESQRMHRP